MHYDIIIPSTLQVPKCFVSSTNICCHVLSVYVIQDARTSCRSDASLFYHITILATYVRVYSFLPVLHFLAQAFMPIQASKVISPFDVVPLNSSTLGSVYCCSQGRSFIVVPVGTINICILLSLGTAFHCSTSCNH